MAWMGLTILMMILDVSLLVSRSGGEPKISITKCRLVEGNTVVCRVRHKEQLNVYETFRGKEAKISERASIFGLGRRISQRRRSKCYLDGSTIRCDGGLKLTGVGSVGRRGSPGLPGPKVGKGEKGGLGSPGRPGPDGKEGPRGFKGPKGDRGSRGEKGDNGDVGREGPQGNPGIPSSCLSVPTTSTLCPRGRPGRKGIKGSTGEEGPLGLKGTKGHRGAKGNKGARGAAGMRGSIGLYGALTLKKPCRQMYSPWVVPNASPIGKLRTECVYREYLMSLEIQPNRSNSKIRYSYKCCPFKASDASKKTFF